MQISKKLTIAFVGLTSLVLIATLSLARWSFEQGFLDYINALEQERLQRVGHDLVEHYQANGESWRSLRPPQFRNMLQQHSANAGMLPEDILNKAPHNQPQQSQRKRPLPARNPFGPPTALFDINGQWLVGADLDRHQGELIVAPLYFNNQQIAELRSLPKRKFDTPQASEFAQQQLLTSIVIGFVCLILAASLAIWLTRLLLNPINQVVAAIAALRKGDFNPRLQYQEPQTDDELNRLMRDVDQLAMTLEQNRSAKNRWQADISHELRTPLTILSGEIEALKAGIRPFDLEQLLSLEQETLRLNRLVEDLYQLSLSDIGGLKYQFSSVDISSRLAQILISLSAQFEAKQLNLQLDSQTDLILQGDTLRLDQLLMNLLSNSIAYTDNGGVILVSLSQIKDTIYLQIEDSNPGVSAAECELLFEPLYRQDVSRTRRASGAGLGLTIARNIVQAHSGRIYASPSKLGGLHITVELMSRVK
ncbi:ATP-binding protein [Pseudoalteromonas tunicata]|jgi:two-component system sensor histidine kinase BaeS|uniref:histidine kinase n=1 Tax=Pseudoalteromonas tunicata D2 TaxID=87626 RepID=A4CDT9_9GAMM|nr:ATP-binding protein [Pseudoalteromonas tunicata]ATC96376.1 two-component system, OmpR family, sensor histidine kinase BaeS [Pseudoalteromonas tunicata]AXT31871.1 HAMP domain-containing protein [Pseudoalteromonas tunicata]EAR27131.1 sensor histidine kinase [Pseudoalteromonas tunicata D2]